MKSINEMSRSELATLAREYMITAQVNDRTGLAAVRLDARNLDYAAVARDALVVLCKEVAVQVHLLVRALGLSILDAAGDDAMAEILEAEMSGTCWIMSERLARMLDVPAGAGNLDAIGTILWLHPAFQPHEYQPIAIDRQGDELILQLLDGPAREDHDGASWSSILRSGQAAGLEALVSAVNRQATVTPLQNGDAPTWVIALDLTKASATIPDWAGIGHLSGSSTFEFETRVDISVR